MEDPSLDRKRQFSSDYDFFDNDLNPKRRMLSAFTPNHPSTNANVYPSSGGMPIPCGEQYVNSNQFANWNSPTGSPVKNTMNSSPVSNNESFMNVDYPVSTPGPFGGMTGPNSGFGSSPTQINSLSDVSMDSNPTMNPSEENKCTDLILHPQYAVQSNSLKSVMWNIVSRKNIQDLLSMTTVELDDHTRRELIRQLKKMGNASDPEGRDESNDEAEADKMSVEERPNSSSSSTRSMPPPTFAIMDEPNTYLNDWMDIDMSS